MKTIKIQSLILENFKGIKSLNLNFKGNTNIYADNGLGKTTIFDAFTWVLFGKDHEGNSKFEIKTLDKNNNVIPKIEHTVEVILSIDDEIVEIQRTLKEKWVKKRGALDAEFTGNETTYFINAVPYLQKDFDSKINEIIPEQIFSVITNSSKFNSMDWKKQRELLIDISGGVSDHELAGDNADFISLLNTLHNKTLDEYKREVAANRKKLNDEIKAIPTRIDEVLRGKEQGYDFIGCRKVIEEKTIELNEVEEQIRDESKLKESINKEKAGLLDEQFRLEQQLKQIEFKVKDENTANDIRIALDLKESELQGKITLRNSIKNRITSIEKEIKELLEKLSRLRESYNKEQLNVFEVPSASTCDKCHQSIELTTEAISEQEKKFNDFKSLRLTSIKTSGVTYKSEIEELKKELEKLDVQLNELVYDIDSREREIADLKVKHEQAKNDLQNLDEILAHNDEYINTKNELKEIAKRIETFVNPASSLELDIKRKNIINEIDQAKSILRYEEENKKIDKRVDELNAQEKELAQLISDSEKKEYIIQEFTKLRINSLESKINNLFSVVNFKLFEQKINGSEVECCVAMVDGVPYSDLNTASKINAGLDIINTITKHYDVNAPVFIDNSESINKFINTDYQTIKLIVSTDKVIRIDYI